MNSDASLNFHTTSALAKRLKRSALLVLYNTAQSDPFDAPMSPQTSPVYPKSVGTSRFSEREKVAPLSAETGPKVAHECRQNHPTLMRMTIGDK